MLLLKKDNIITYKNSIKNGDSDSNSGSKNSNDSCSVNESDSAKIIHI